MDAQALTQVTKIPEMVILKHVRTSGVCRSEAAFRAAELEKFLFIAAKSPEPCVPSKVVDEIWHDFLLFSELYHWYCIKNFGVFVGHDPAPTETSSVLEECYENTKKAIEIRFGLNASLWPTVSKQSGVAICKSPCKGHVTAFH